MIVKSEVAVEEVVDLVSELVRRVVTQPDNLKVTHTLQGKLLAISFRPQKDDVGKLLGRHGKHWRAIRLIAQLLTKEQGIEVHMAIDEEGPPAEAQRSEKVLASKRKFQTVVKLLERVVGAIIGDPSAVRVTSKDLGEHVVMTPMALYVKASLFPKIFGEVTRFDYGDDGSVIGSIKNLFDGIGKNYGRTVRITLIAED